MPRRSRKKAKQLKTRSTLIMPGNLRNLSKPTRPSKLLRFKKSSRIQTTINSVSKSVMLRSSKTKPEEMVLTLSIWRERARFRLRRIALRTSTAWAPMMKLRFVENLEVWWSLEMATMTRCWDKQSKKRHLRMTVCKKDWEEDVRPMRISSLRNSLK